jgi:hypothetical protein
LSSALSEIDDLHSISLLDFLKLFVNESILILEDEETEIKSILKEITEMKKVEPLNSSNFIDFIKNKLKNIF